MTEQLCDFPGCGQSRHGSNHPATGCEYAHQLTECHPFTPPPAEAKAAGRFGKGTPERETVYGTPCNRDHMTGFQQLLAAIDERDERLANFQDLIALSVRQGIVLDHAEEALTAGIAVAEDYYDRDKHRLSQTVQFLRRLNSMRATLAEILALRGGGK